MKLLIFAFVFIFVTSCQAEAEQRPSGERSPAVSNSFQFISSLTLPDKLDICGERLPLEIPEVRERAEREFYLLLQQPGQIILYIKRAGRYFPMYERLLKEHEMPDDIKYVSVAESALFQARSSRGAVGLWQFMEATGRSMGLRIDKDVDERRNPEKSTRAALNYLKRGYFTQKNWTSTIAGYNMGQSGVTNALRYQSVESYYDLFLNEETSRFIFRIAIIKELMANAEKYGFNIPKWEQYSADKVKTILVSTAVTNLAEWARSQGTTYKDVKLLNPWILGRSLPAPSRGEVWEIDIPE